MLLRVGFSETGSKRFAARFKMTDFAPKSGLTTLIVADMYPPQVFGGYIPAYYGQRIHIRCHHGRSRKYLPLKAGGMGVKR
jgi:hypothetical protein